MDASNPAFEHMTPVMGGPNNIPIGCITEVPTEYGYARYYDAWSAWPTPGLRDNLAHGVSRTEAIQAVLRNAA